MHTRQLDLPAFVSTEIHKQFGRVFSTGGDSEKEAAMKKIGQRLQYLSARLTGACLLGDTMTVADAYFYVMLRWVVGKGIGRTAPLNAYMSRMAERPAAKLALAHEGIIASPTKA